MPEAGTQLDTAAIFKFFYIFWKISSLVPKVILILTFRRAHFLQVWSKPSSFSGLSTVKSFLEESKTTFPGATGILKRDPGIKSSSRLSIGVDCHGFSVVVQHLC